MNSAPPPVFEAKNLQVIRGGSLILNVPSLVVSEGEILVLVGPNGAGKSTILQTLSALVNPSRGEILFRGQKIGTDLPVLQYRRKLAMVLQEPLLFDTTVYHNVASGLKIRGMKRAEIEPIVEKTLARFAIAHLRDRSARTLSGGEARRVSIARAFATNPEVLLLDEPFAALDPIIRETLLADLEQVLRETRLTTIFVTHNRMEALRLAMRLGVMKAGEILQIDSPEAVMSHPVNEFVASLIGMENILRGKVKQCDNGAFTASVAGQEIKAIGNVATGDQLSLCIRPENVTLSAHEPTNRVGVTNVLSGVIEKVTPLGFYRKVHINCEFPLIAYAPNHSSASFSLAEGVKVSASFHAMDIHVIKH
jgi:tungstate transport system ATP-binding protein